MLRAVLTSAITLGGAMALAGTAAAGSHSKCGKVSWRHDWASASLMANVDAFILKEGYGCEAEIVPGDTIPTFTSMNERVIRMSPVNYGSTQYVSHWQSNV